MSPWKIAVTDYRYENLDLERRVFGQLDYELVEGKCRTEDEVIDLAHDADAILCNYAPIGAAVAERLNRCRIISKNGVGLNTVDLDAATRRGIAVANVPDYGVEEVSNHALAMLLHFARGLGAYNAAVKSGVWDYRTGAPLRRASRQTLGLIGFGRIAQRLAEKAIFLGMNALVYDPYVQEERLSAVGAASAPLAAVLQEADYISLHAPLTAQTHHLIGREQLALMKPTAVLINTARGPLINEEHLAAALRERRIRGAALDVQETEPMSPEHPFARLDNVLLSPHCAWYSEEAMVELRCKAAQNIVDVLSGFAPPYLVNPEVRAALRLRETEERGPPNWSLD